jgi:Protein of unknown function (DUF2971)
MEQDRAHDALRRRISRAALHYTSGSGAKGIFESRTLWAGHLGYMSDISEVGHAMSVRREVVKRLKRELSEHQGALQRWTEYVTDNPPKSWAPNVFAVSFSEGRDLLSQWRGHATGASGPFCIGLPSAMLRERVDAGEGLVWILRKCIYSRDEQAELIEARIRRGLDLAANAEVLPRDKTPEDFGWNHIFGAVMEVAPVCKHPAFAEEREWRLLFGPVSGKKVETVHFVERRHTLAPYIEFQLAEGDVLDHTQWIAGPGPQQELANSALEMVAQAAGMTRYHGMPSQTPYLP